MYRAFQAVAICPEEPYEVFYPLTSGALNTAGGRSAHAVEEDIGRVWAGEYCGGCVCVSASMCACVHAGTYADVYV